MTNIQRHEQQDQTRTSIFDVLGEDEEFGDFEDLLEKCARADRDRRPRNAIELREEVVLVDFLRRIEAGERPSEIVPTPFENEHETEIRQLREELARKDGIIADLQSRLDVAGEEATEKDEIIRERDQVRIENSKIVLFGR